MKNYIEGPGRQRRLVSHVPKGFIVAPDSATPWPNNVFGNATAEDVEAAVRAHNEHVEGKETIGHFLIQEDVDMLRAMGALTAAVEARIAGSFSR